MLLIHFKQAWNLIGQEKLFSSLYIIGTGLSITVVTALSIVYYIRIANIYPETNRDRMLTVAGAVEESPDGDISSSQLSYMTVETCFLPLQEAEAVSVIYEWWGKEHYVQPEGSREQLPVSVKYVNSDFWKVFDFRFLRGAPFTEADFQSGIRSVVLSESMSKRLFGAADATGRYISLNFMPCRVCGTVKDVSFVTGTAYAQIWIPYTVYPDCKTFSFGKAGTLGSFRVDILAPSAGDREKIRNEALDNVRKLNTTLPERIELKLMGQPDRHWQSTFRLHPNEAPDFTKIFLQYGLLFLVLLLIPGISLSGMTDSRMERRLSEMGIRRVFGAPVSRLMGQIFSENLLFTLLGGCAGLIFSWLLILLCSDWIMTVGQGWRSIPPDGTDVVFTPAMLVNIPAFLITLAVCFLLNLVTAVIPAWRASHRDLILSIKN
ncbi:MAG: ABC transporter permease [Tannerella sp.]|jgi:putative ABC transport system permease protein|nr:ABC transporter permease [Tannerella sp.]